MTSTTNPTSRPDLAPISERDKKKAENELADRLRKELAAGGGYNGNGRQDGHGGGCGMSIARAVAVTALLVLMAGASR